VRELEASIAASGADGGFVVTSGHFTPAAITFAQAHGIELIDGPRLKQLIRPEEGKGRREPFLGAEAITAALQGFRDRALDRRAAPASASAAVQGHPGRGSPPPSPGSPTHARGSGPGAEDMEAAIGRELSALVRSDDAAVPPHLLAPPLPLRPPAPSRRRRRRTFRLSKAKVLDLVGIALVSAGIWAGFQWFQSLPQQPDASPWALLGSGTGEIGRDAIGARPSPPDRDQRPLGQINYGGSWENRTPSPPVALPAEEPVVEYRSIRELEAAFDSKYVPPPECYRWETTAEMAKCGNHRLRARRAFIESGGKITPEMLGAIGTFEAYRPPPPIDPVPDWRQTQESDSYFPSEPYSDEPWDPSWQEQPHDGDAWRRSPGAGFGPDGAPPRDLGGDPDPWPYPPRDATQDWTDGRDWRDATPSVGGGEWREGPSGPGDWQQAGDWRAPEYADQPAGWLPEQDQYRGPQRDGGVWQEDPRWDTP
jgi:hypothetical protein